MTIHDHTSFEDFIAATGERADIRATAYIGNDHMMTGYGDGFRAGAVWARGHLAADIWDEGLMAGIEFEQCGECAPNPYRASETA